MKKTTRIAFLLVLTMISMISSIQMTSATLISISKIQLQGGSEDDNGNWKGGYWVFSVAVDQADSMVGKLILPANTSVEMTDKDGSKFEVKTNVSIEFQFTPQKAYYKRLLKIPPAKDRLILPKYYRGGENKITTAMFWDTSVSSGKDVLSPHYTWAESSWHLYTLWNVRVYLKGKLIGNATFNTEGGTKDLVVHTTEGNILIKHLGRLQGDYGQPQVPSGAVIFNEQYVYESDALKYIKYDDGGELKKWDSVEHVVRILEGSEAYSVYWTGDVRWTPNKFCDVNTSEVEYRPAPYQLDWWGMRVIDAGKGWEAADDFWNYARNPVLPPIFPSDKNDATAQYDSLIEYLNRKTARGNIADSWLDGYEGWHIEYNNGEAKAVVVDVPWGAYSGIPLAVCYVPTELVKTWVYRIPISNVKIESVKWQEGTKTTDIIDTKRCAVTLKQYAKVRSSATIYATVSTDRASITPMTKTITLDKGEEATYWFEVKNLGVNDTLEGTVTFTIKRTWDGVVTDKNSELKFKLIPQSSEWTIVDVLVTDRISKNPVSGIMVYCSAEGMDLKQGVTGDRGIVTFNLGTYSGSITLQTKETKEYKSATVSTMVSGRSQVEIQLEKQNEKVSVAEIPPWILVAILCGSLIAITWVAIIYKDRRMSKMHRTKISMLYKQYCKDMGVDVKNLATTGFKTSKSLVKRILGEFGIVGKKLESLKLLMFGVFVGVIGLFWYSNVSPFLSKFLPWLPQGFSIKLGWFSIWIGVDSVLITIGALFVIAGLYDILRSKTVKVVVSEENKE